MAGPVKGEPQHASAQKAPERTAQPEQTSADRPLVPLYGIQALSRPMPSNGAPHQIRAILNLQRTIGNRATGQLLRRTAAGRIQAKLTVGPAGDMYEREADAAADRVAAGKPVERLSRLPAGGPPQRAQRQPEAEEEETVQTQPAAEEKDLQEIQRQEAEEEGPDQRQETAEEEQPLQTARGTEAVQRLCPACKEDAQRQIDEEEKPVQTKGSKGETGLDTAASESAMARSGSGDPLSPDLQGQMEQSFGADFSAVRVHSGPAAQDANQAINARAFTHGKDIYLGRGESTSNTRLMAHELTHVIQQKKADPSASMQSRTPGPGVQRWASLGEEHYHSPPHTEEGVGIIAGVPEPGQGQVATTSNPIMVGDAQSEGQLPGESEWRSLLGSAGEQAAIAVYAFLRTALLTDTRWLQHVRRYYDGNPAQSQLMRNEGVRFDTADRQVRQPTEEEEMALAKAIYLRGQSRLSFDFDEFPGLAVLMNQFLRRMQPQLIERMAEHNIRYGAENVEAATRAASPQQQATMIGSGAGTLTRAVAKFASWEQVKRRTQPRSAEETEAERYKMMALREAEMAGQTLRGVADEASEIRREQVERWKAIIGAAVAAIPLPGVAQFITRTSLGMAETAVRTAVEAVIAKAAETMAAERVRDGLAGALAQSDFNRRIQLIRTEVVWSIREFELGDEEDDFVNTVNATLVGAGH